MSQDAVTATAAARVRLLRRQRGWTGQQLADAMTAIGVPWNRGLVSKLELGYRESITVAELVALAQLFEVSPMDVLQEPAPPAPPPVELPEDMAEQVRETARLVHAIASRFGIEVPA